MFRNMPQLKNPKHERFCQNVIDGMKHKWTQAEIYMRSGYKAEGHSAEIAASRLLKKDEIQSRIAELTAPAARKARLTADTLMQKFERIEQGAIEAEQFGPAGRAAELQGKLSGLMIDRTEIGAPGDFADCNSLSDMALRMLDEADLDDHLELLDRMRTELLKAAGNRARKVVDSSEPVGLAPGAKTALALQALRPDRRNGRHR